MARKPSAPTAPPKSRDQWQRLLRGSDPLGCAVVILKNLKGHLEYSLADDSVEMHTALKVIIEKAKNGEFDP